MTDITTAARSVEVMAPVGSFAALAAAIRAGADSVYFGVTQLNMRARAADNMSINDMAEIVRRARAAGVKTYVVVNTLLYDHDMRVARAIVDTARAAGVDAVIAADFACVRYCNDIGMPVQMSVQFSISNYETVAFFAQFTNRVVLARELNLEQIGAIARRIAAERLMGREGRLMEIEVFAHGALCVAQSGRCYMSLYHHNASANRGVCRQTCRMKYKVTNMETGKELVVDNHYVMSAADICTVDFLDQVIAAGAQVLKIEGRGRPPEYVDTVVRTYKKALAAIASGTYTPAAIASYMADVRAVFHRTLSHGNYYLGREIGAYSPVYGSRATQYKEYVARVTHYYRAIGVAEVYVEAGTLARGDAVVVIGATTGVLACTVGELRVDDTPVPAARKGTTVTLAVPDRVRVADKMYIVRTRDRDTKQPVTASMV